MNEIDRRRVEALVASVQELSPGQFAWLERSIQIFRAPRNFRIYQTEFFDEKTLENFGDALRIHHGFSAEPFSKDKFEYVLERVVNMESSRAKLAPKGNRGHDITIDGIPVSLKTQADKAIKDDRLWISKFMELGRGSWGDDPSDLDRLLEMFLRHLHGYEKVLMLRALNKAPDWVYELVEIPKALLLQARNGILEMKTSSAQYPKPGYCYVRKGDVDLYQLYFDGGSERKLQVKNLLKSQCIVHARWEFTIPEA
ncbi:MAG TPA: restriction endonuclease [Chlorobaculum parvum]|uniref:Restriction endonuclease n=1 Tax=Chlorobaculum parvum TaxID=274539 RepID=A0A7C5HLT4_9CHLB|nr:restriction endonuclease [Chlorobaculum parvum]